MNTLSIDKKKIVVMSQEEYEILVTKAARKTPLAKKMSLAEGKRMAYKLIDKWAKEKL
jgi:hypothetical protein